MPRVSVQIEWPPGLTTLPPDATAHVTVEDATRVDASSVVVAETVLSDLGGRTPLEALDSGMTPKEVWAVVWRVLELPARDR